MFGLRRTPLAWCLLTHDKKRLFLSLLGVAFAVLLMFIEMGFLNGVYDSQTLLTQALDADLVVAHRFREAIVPPRPISRARLMKALHFPGVEAVYPLYLEVRGIWKGLHRGSQWMAVVGMDLDHLPLLLPELRPHLEQLRLPGKALVDARSRSVVGPMATGVTAELNGQRVEVVGEYTLGPDFVVDSRLVMSDRNFVRYFPDPQTGQPNLDRIDMGLIKAAPGADIKRLQRQIQELMPGDVRVFTKQGLVDAEIHFFATNQPVGLVFGIGMVVGFVIGVTICYQILFNEINDHQAEFATLKAIGYANSYLVQVVLREAVYLSLLAFVPGVLGAHLVYGTLQGITSITMRLTPDRVVTVLVLTVVMCIVSGTLAVRKVLSSDPAEVFG